MQNTIDINQHVLTGKKVLLFAQYFFGYENKIAEKLRQLGAIVSLYDERSVTRPIEKAILKISPSLFQGKTDKYYDNIIEKEKNTSYDYILFIDCEMVSRRILLTIRESFPKAKLCLYLWDSLQNLKGVPDKLDLFDYISSFDRTDSSKQEKIHFRPLFFCDEYRMQNNNTVKKYDIAFIGTIHSDRYNIIKKLKEKIPNFYIYAYLQSQFMFYYFWLTKKEYRGTSKNTFKYEKISSKDISEIVEQSRTILDIQHPKQTGLTMRTIEMLGMRKKFITTNSDISNYDFYNPNNICIIDRINPDIPSDFFTIEYQDIPNQVYEYYSIEQWVFDVLDVS